MPLSGLSRKLTDYNFRVIGCGWLLSSCPGADRFRRLELDVALSALDGL